MLIEKISLLEFDEVAERARINQVFKGTTRDLLLAVLDAMVAGQWEQFRALAIGLPKDHVEYLAEPVFELARDLQEQRKRRIAYADGYVANPATRLQMSPMTAIALGPESAHYPQFKLTDGQAPVAPIPGFGPRTIRYMPASGVTREERDYARRSTLYRSGDMVLVWANEGDLVFHQRMPAPPDADADATAAAEAKALMAQTALLLAVSNLGGITRAEVAPNEAPLAIAPAPADLTAKGPH